MLVYAVVFLHFDKSLSQPHNFAFAFTHFLTKRVNNICKFLLERREKDSLKYLEYLDVWSCVWQDSFCASGRKANLNSQ